MSKKKPTYAELQARLEQAEATLNALRRGEIDSLMGEAGPLLVRYKSAVDELARLQAEAERLAREWQATFDATSDAVWILDAEQRVVRSNRAAEETFHCPIAEMYGRRCCEIAHQTAAPIPECPFRLMRQSLRRESLEMQLGERWFAVTTDPILDAEGNLTGAVHIAHDITERKRAEEKIRESEETYRNLFQNAQVGLFRTRISDGKILESNEQLARMFGYDNREEFIAEYVTSQNYVDAGTRERMLSELRRNGMVQNFQARFYRKDGSIFWAQYSAKIYPDKGWIEGVAEDITARKRAEEALRESQQYLQAVLDSISDAVFVDDADTGEIIDVNRGMCEMYGYSREEALGTPIGELSQGEPPYSQAEALEWLRKAREMGPQTFEWLAKHKDGRLFWVEVSIRFAIIGGHNRFVVVVRDITARKQAEEALRQSEERFRLISSVVSDYMFSSRLEADGRWQPEWVAGAFEQVTGYTFEEYVARGGWRAIVHPDDLAIDDRDAEKLAANRPIDTEIRIVAKSGEIRWVHVYAQPVFDAQRGQLIGVYGAGQDITVRKQAEAQIMADQAELQRLLAEAERSRRALLSVVEDQKKTEEALRESNRRLSLLNRLGLALAQTLDLPTIYRTAYEHISQLVDCPCFGVSRYDPVAQTLRAEYMLDEGELLDPALFPPLPVGPDLPLKGRVRAVQAQQPEIVSQLPTPSSGPLTIVGKSDEEHIARSALYVPIIVRGQTIGLLEMQSYRENAYGEADIALLGPVANQIGLAMENARLFADLEAERNSLAQRVRERTAELEAVNRELEAFAYSVSHDLRAPLRALDGFSAVLLSRYPEQLDEQGQHYLNRIREASRRMGQLIEDLLKLSRVTRREMSRLPVDLSALAREIAAELQTREPQRQVEFVIAPQMIVQGDAHLLRIALENLMNNAWKFTARREQARIEFGVIEQAHKETGRQVDQETLLVYFIRDNGVGFDMTYADKLFTPFQRLHGAEEFPGTGIGLATVQRIIARHGGRIWAEAAVDQGATFYFILRGA